MLDSNARVPRVCSSSTALTVFSNDVTFVTIIYKNKHNQKLYYKLKNIIFRHIHSTFNIIKEICKNNDMKCSWYSIVSNFIRLINSRSKPKKLVNQFMQSLNMFVTSSQRTINENFTCIFCNIFYHTSSPQSYKKTSTKDRYIVSANRILVNLILSLIHIWRCRRKERCRYRWWPYH